MYLLHDVTEFWRAPITLKNTKPQPLLQWFKETDTIKKGGMSVGPSLTGSSKNLQLHTLTSRLHILLDSEPHCSCPYIPWLVRNTCGFVWCHVVEYSLTVLRYSLRVSDIHCAVNVDTDCEEGNESTSSVCNDLNFWNQMCMHTRGYIANGWYSSTFGLWSVFTLYL